MQDLIGDVHGHSTELKSQLTKMVFQELNGVWQQAKHTVIFFGCWCGSWVGKLEVVHVTNAIIETSKAKTVMGNHEFNAVPWVTPESNKLWRMSAHPIQGNIRIDTKYPVIN